MALGRCWLFMIGAVWGWPWVDTGHNCQGQRRGGDGSMLATVSGGHLESRKMRARHTFLALYLWEMNQLGVHA